ncbi:Retrovirus-related Pol polyprotein from type-1 retrotransposable element R1 4 [Amphibalanus amphitrite]|uniref:Retrovirus-related Pol polyprotein from type-1 retrotransposable element R1 4 n=1 Tax=Amphibalanus amphitrite TaxID=1232801 RepID=A0A6A4WXU2_AMPAM|nr:Retrovirus-related Pol polyprotein from type-1 retrotransposable element R1 4 [Amphibalanus amphitrite]
MQHRNWSRLMRFWCRSGRYRLMLERFTFRTGHGGHRRRQTTVVDEDRRQSPTKADDGRRGRRQVLGRWQVLNSGTPTRAGYGEDARLSAPDVTLAHSDLARRCTWEVGTDLGSDHLPQMVAVTTSGHRPRRIRKTRWAFHKADWTAFTARCEETMADLTLGETSVERLAARFNDAIIEASARCVPRGARADPKPWALDPELVRAVEERRAARAAVQEDPSPENQTRWKEKKRHAADVEADARRRAFQDFASTELNRRAALGRVTKILRKMEGAVTDTCPGQAINGDRGQLVAEDRAKAEAFVRTYANVSSHTRHRRRDRSVKVDLRVVKTRPCSCAGQRDGACQPFSRQEMRTQLDKLKMKKAPGADDHYVDARDLYIHVDGARVDAGRHLHLLGVTLDRQLHMGEHCARVRKKTKPRIAQLRKMTGRSWGLREPQLRVVANGYIRGALEYAAAAWLPATSESHVELLEMEMRAAARVITGCPVSTPRDPLLAEAGLVPVRARRDLLAARLSCLAASQRSGDPLRAVAEATAPWRLRTTTGWRDTGARALVSAGVRDVPVEERLHVTIPPWIDDTRVQIRLDIGNHISRTAPPDVRRERAEEHLATLPDDAVWVWSDGSAEGGVSAGGSGALIILPSGEEHELRAPAGKICSSTRAELVAIRGALEMLLQLEGGLAESPVIVCADSQAALATLASGAGSQTTALGAAVWRLLLALTDGGRRVFMQWIPAHCGIPGNERADVLAKEASSLSQDAVPTDVRSMVKAVGRSATKAWRRSWPDSFFKTIMGDRMPMPVLLESRDEAVNVHQLRAGHWSRSQSYLHRIGRRPERDCPQCSDLACPAARCLVCREGPDTPEHVLLRCPCLAGARLRLLGNIRPDPTQLRDGGAVAALSRGYLSHQEPLGCGRP